MCVCVQGLCYGVCYYVHKDDLLVFPSVQVGCAAMHTVCDSPGVAIATQAVSAARSSLLPRD